MMHRHSATPHSPLELRVAPAEPAIYLGTLKPQLDLDAEILKRAVLYPHGASSRDAAMPAPFNGACGPSTPAAPAADPPGGRRGVGLLPPGTTAGTLTARVVAWLVQRAAPATTKEVKEALGAKAPGALYNLRKTRTVAWRTYRVPSSGHPWPAPQTQWQAKGRAWPALPAGAVEDAA